MSCANYSTANSGSFRSSSERQGADREGDLKETQMNGWSGISAITLFVEDLAATLAFYEDIFGLSVHSEDPESCAFMLGNILVNLLVEPAVPELISPAALVPRAAGSRAVVALIVEDVDVTCAELTARGADPLNVPTDRPWGIRTASLIDPNGYDREITSWRASHGCVEAEGIA
jgi:lactoylglutathione lyase